MPVRIAPFEKIGRYVKIVRFVKIDLHGSQVRRRVNDLPPVSMARNQHGLRIVTGMPKADRSLGSLVLAVLIARPLLVLALVQKVVRTVVPSFVPRVVMSLGVHRILQARRTALTAALIVLVEIAPKRVDSAVPQALLIVLAFLAVHRLIEELVLVGSTVIVAHPLVVVDSLAVRAVLRHRLRGTPMPEPTVAPMVALERLDGTQQTRIVRARESAPGVPSQHLVGKVAAMLGFHVPLPQLHEAINGQHGIVIARLQRSAPAPNRHGVHVGLASLALF